VILDELTTGLDPAARRRMWRTIEQLQADGVTILLISHAMEEVERLCDRIVLLQAGRVLATGTPAELVAEAGTSTLDEAFVQFTGHEMETAE
jgi:ABC-2 type transport system ATP-binding protein